MCCVLLNAFILLGLSSASTLHYIHYLYTAHPLLYTFSAVGGSHWISFLYVFVSLGFYSVRIQF